MFTIETAYDCSVVTSLDEAGCLEDIEVVLDEERVYISQLLPDSDRAQVLEISYQQWLDVLVAMDLPDGAYHRRKKDNYYE